MGLQIFSHINGQLHVGQPPDLVILAILSASLLFAVAVTAAEVKLAMKK